MRSSKRSRVALIGVMALALSVTVGLLSGSVADAKKKKKKTGTVTATVQATNVAVPDKAPPATSVDGRVDIPLTISGKKFKQKVVAAESVVVTIQTTGSAPGAAGDLEFRLISPKGRKNTVVAFVGDQNIGPLTITPDSRVDLCDITTPPCQNPDATLNRPFAGTAGNEELAEYTGVKMSGTWILEVIDDTIGGTNVVNLAKLQITGATPSGVA